MRMMRRLYFVNEYSTAVVPRLDIFELGGKFDCWSIVSVVTVTLINVRNVGSFGNKSSESVNVGVLGYLHVPEIGPTYHRRCGAGNIRSHEAGPSTPKEST